jgi:hypothetical protein
VRPTGGALGGLSHSRRSDVESVILYPQGPDMTESPSVTGLLREAGRGDRQALDRLVPLVYETLRSLAEPGAGVSVVAGPCGAGGPTAWHRVATHVDSGFRSFQ